MQQYFIDTLAPNIGEVIEITDSETFNHIFRVMRVKEGDFLNLVFNDQKLAHVRVISEGKVEILDYPTYHVELPFDVTIAVGYPKGDKLDFIVQKATELGASEILAFPATWSVSRPDAKKLDKKRQRLAKIAQGASEQSKRLKIPHIELLSKQKDLLDKFSDYDNVLVAYEESAKEGEGSALVENLKKTQKGDKLLVIFGPEGGLSPDEVGTFISLGASSMGLGPRIMRAETAPLYALSSISFYSELLK